MEAERIGPGGPDDGGYARPSSWIFSNPPSAALRSILRPCYPSTPNWVRSCKTSSTRGSAWRVSRPRCVRRRRSCATQPAQEKFVVSEEVPLQRPGTAGARPACACAAAAEQGGWLGDWLRRHPPLRQDQYPFLNSSGQEGEIGRLGQYRLFEVIGSGGMGVVFRGEDAALHRPVAVKVLRAELAADPAFRERFLREARAAAAIDHEHVVSVYHVGDEAGVPFLGMQWLRGMSLEELLRRSTWPR